MKRFFTLLLVILFYSFVLTAQSVVVVDDDNNNDEFEPIVIALQQAGYTFDSLNLEHLDTLLYSDISNYDMVIWNVGDDRVAIKLFDTISDPEHVKFYPALQQYYDNQDGAIWIDGIDFLKCLVVHTDGSSNDHDQIANLLPLTFTEGSFVHDVLGIAEWNYESKTLESNGVPQADKTDQNTITSLNTIRWQWSSLWRADGWTPVNGAISLYQMGDVSYPGAGYSMFIKYENAGVKLYVSTLRLGKLGNGSSFDQAVVNSIVSDIVEDAVGTPSLIGRNTDHIKIYPNPARDYLNISGVEAGVITISDLAGKKLISQKISDNSHIDISGLAQGIYNIEIENSEGIESLQFFVK